MADSHLMTPQERALSTYPIRRKLMREYLDAEDLLTLRSVSREWEREATSVLLTHQRSLGVSFKCCKERDLCFEEDHPHWTLEMFKTMLSSSRLYPVTEYIITYDRIERPDILEFLTDPQVSIQSLSLTCPTPDTRLSSRILWKILEARKDTLEYLSIGSSPFRWPEPPSANFWMPKLKTFSARCMDPLYRLPNDVILQILTRAPALVEFDDPRSLYLETVVQLKKIHLVKTWHLNFWFDHPDYLGQANGWSTLLQNQCPTLSTLTINEKPIDFSNQSWTVRQVVQSILNKSRESLQTIENFLALVLCRDLKPLGTFNNVTILVQRTFNLVQQHGGGLKDKGTLSGIEEQREKIQLSQIFPNVKELCLGNYFDERTVDLSILTGIGNLMTVSRLVLILSPSTSQDKTLLCQLFDVAQRLCPNVKGLYVQVMRGPILLPEILQLVWTKFPGLIYLSCYFNIKSDKDLPYDDEWLSRVDCAVVGLPFAECKLLGQSSVKSLSEEMGRIKPTLASIQDCKNLQYFGIDCILNDSQRFPLFSPLSFSHGFDLMSNLNVDMKF